MVLVTAFAAFSGVWAALRWQASTFWFPRQAVIFWGIHVRARSSGNHANHDRATTRRPSSDAVRIRDAYHRTKPCQVGLFATFSLIVKYGEQLAFGTWEHGHFFGIQGNFTYVLGWSLLDGLLPFVIRAGLHVLARLGVNGLVSIRAS